MGSRREARACWRGGGGREGGARARVGRGRKRAVEDARMVSGERVGGCGRRGGAEERQMRRTFLSPPGAPWVLPILEGGVRLRRGRRGTYASDANWTQSLTLQTCEALCQP